MLTYIDAIRTSPQGVLLFVHVIAESSQRVFPGKYDPWRNSIEIKVRSQAKDNKANGEILECISRFFQLTIKDVVLLSGEKQREKTICLKNITVDMVRRKLQRFFDG